MRHTVLRILVFNLLLDAAGCGAAPSAAKSPEPPPPPPVVVAAPEAATAGAPAPPQAVVMPMAPADRGGTGRARADLVAARRELEASSGNCTAACRALGSMDRAAGQICSFAASPDETAVCGDAKATVVRARGQVRAACGTCPAGPSVDANAPVPSSP